MRLRCTAQIAMSGVRCGHLMWLAWNSKTKGVPLRRLPKPLPRPSLDISPSQPIAVFCCLLHQDGTHQGHCPGDASQNEDRMYTGLYRYVPPESVGRTLTITQLQRQVGTMNARWGTRKCSKLSSLCSQGSQNEIYVYNFN